MEQHHVQDAYLKLFREQGGRIWVFSKVDGTRQIRPTSKCTVEEDFQSSELESEQNTKIETPAIKILKALAVGEKVPLNSQKLVAQWMSLHNVRNKKIRDAILEEEGVDRYDEWYRRLLAREQSLAATFRFGSVCGLSAADESLLTSDNPVVDFYVEGRVCRLLPLNPRKFLLLSREDGQIQSEEQSLGQLVNGMTWVNAYEQVFSSQQEIDIESVKNRISPAEIMTREDHQRTYGDLCLGEVVRS